jgi:glycosyltransferase involved in cell wall biosynthesis
VTTIAAILNSKDSAATIKHALASVASLADEVLVVDMESVDGTDRIAREAGARVLSIPTQPIADGTRDQAVGAVSAEWVLMLDADEFVSPALARELRRIAEADEADVVRLPMVNYLLGAPARFTSWSPRHDRHWRFFKPGALAFPGRVHTMPTVMAGSRARELPYEDGRCLVHLAYVDTSDFLGRLDRYTDLEAQRLTAVGDWSPWRMLWQVVREVGVRLVVRQGFRDGWRGVHLSLLMGVYRYVAHVRQWERERVGSRAEVEALYDAEAARWLAGDHREV